MSDSSEDETISRNWVIVEQNDVDTKKPDEFDSDSDGISVISESTAHESTNEEDIQPAVEVVEELPGPKWTYVEESNNLEASNKFYLDCMQEPVHELNENDLGTLHSDLESDGISIISETESSNDEIQNLSGTEIVKKVETNNKTFLNFVKNYLNNKYFLVTVLLATISIFISHIFDQIDDEFIVKPKYSKKFDTKYELDVNKYSPIQYCQQLHKNDGIFMEVNVKKCLTKTMQNKYKKLDKMLTVWEKIVQNKDNETLADCIENKKNIKVKEEYLKKKEQFLIEKEYELLKTELKYIKKNKNSRKQDESSAEKMSKKTKKTITYKYDEKHDKYKVKNDTKKENFNYKYNKKIDKPKYDKKNKKYDEKIYKEDKKYKNTLNKKDPDGSWHIKMHEARNNLRKKQQTIECHKWKRTKPNWYLLLMKNREYIRDKLKYIPTCM